MTDGEDLIFYKALKTAKLKVTFLVFLCIREGLQKQNIFEPTDILPNEMF